MVIIRGLLKKICSWPFSTDPEGHEHVNWVDDEKEDFYDHVNNRRYFAALQMIRNKATRYSMDEMGHLMAAFERDVIGAEIITIEKDE